MELFTEDEIKIILEKCHQNNDDFKYKLESYSKELVGFLGEHLRLIIDVKRSERTLVLFVKCIPRFDKYKAQYLRETTFFQKEYVLLSSLFSQFSKCEGTTKWRPELLYIKENVFVFEDVTQIGYKMPDCQDIFTYEETVATLESLATFHAQSIIFEEKKSKEFKRTYRIWEDFSEFLTEPVNGQQWRDTGRNGVVDFLKTFSVHKDKPNFTALVDKVIPELFNRAMKAIKPSSKYRNVVIHRDVWANNVFFKRINGKMHCLIVDFQTALYTCPMLDVTSFLFFNTNKAFRDTYKEKILDIYYECLEKTLEEEGINITEVFTRKEFIEAYEDSILFGITQAALILPIANLPAEVIDEYRDGGDKNHEFDSISRSSCFINTARHYERYYQRVLELFDDIVERYILPLI